MKLLVKRTVNASQVPASRKYKEGYNFAVRILNQKKILMERLKRI